MENLRIHDVVSINREHKDPQKKYYGGTNTGVIVSINENQLVFIDATGDEVIQPFTEDEYTVAISLSSEIIFQQLIEKKIESQKKTIERAEDDLKALLTWYDTFTREISMLGKLMRYMKSYTTLNK